MFGKSCLNLKHNHNLQFTMMKQIFQRMVLGMALCLSVGTFAWAQSYTPTLENLQARKEFQDNKFGIFLHWGI